MARQHVHNRRAGHTSGSGASWISYSDIMAALVLVFVLFLVYNLYQYNTTLLQAKQKLAEQEARLGQQEGIILIQQNALAEAERTVIIAKGELEIAQGELKTAQAELKTAQDDLQANIIILGEKEAELAQLQMQLADKELALSAATAELEAQRQAFLAQTGRITGIVGVRTEIIQELSQALSANNINAKVDPITGDIVLESAVFFETASYEIKLEGQIMLNQFLPVYLSVLLDPKYSDYMGEIIIEGHTDSSGTYLRNLELSQNRALAVAKYCLSCAYLTPMQQQQFQDIMTATGRSSSDPIYDVYGNEDKDASRRVEFKFSLRDADMVAEMEQILNQSNGGGAR